jgi:hypothetical protein
MAPAQTVGGAVPAHCPGYYGWRKKSGNPGR